MVSAKVKEKARKSEEPQKTVLKAHIISHNHWDREWIFTAKYANRWLPPFFDNLFKMLEKEPSYRFVLDGQTLIIEDYLDQLSQDEARSVEKKLKHYIKEGRLLIGPAYLQPDWGLVSGEALVRNLLIGHKMAKKFGDVMKVGWMLDNFGQIAQAPQIYQGFGIEGAFVWRGIELPPDEIKSEFWWESPDGSKILAVYLLDSYRNAMVLSLTREIARERIHTHSQVLSSVASTPNVLLMNGYEQVPWPDDVLPIIRDFNKNSDHNIECLQSTPPEYLASVHAHQPDLPVLKGYLYSGKYMPILKGVFSSRSKLKQQNNECQRELERWAEPFATLAWIFGSEYPHSRLERAWKTLLLNHTHDDVCGCNIDTIARDMQHRFEQVYKSAHDISENSLRAITHAINTSRYETSIPIVVFNPSSRMRSHVFGVSVEIPAEIQSFSIKNRDDHPVAFQLLRREGDRADIYIFASNVPSLGYKTYYIVPGEEAKIEATRTVHASKAAKSMENDYIKVSINENGTLNIHNKQNNRSYDNLGYFEDGGDAGDTYDYSYPEQDKIITSLHEKAKITLEAAGPYMAMFRIELTMTLPQALTPDRKSRTEETQAFPIVSFVELSAASRKVEVHTFLRNSVKDHRFRIMFPTQIITDYSYAEEPFDIAKFPIKSESVTDDIPPKMRQVMLAGRYTVPVNTRILQNFMGLENSKHGLSIISSKLSEYEILEGKNTIALTLLRSVGWLARQDLMTRIGDVGPHIFTPEAQEIGDHVLSYAIFPNSGDWIKERPHFAADNHNLNFRVVQTDIHKGELPEEYTSLGWEAEDSPGSLRMTSVKCTEDWKGFIVRFYNTREYPVSAELNIDCKIIRAFKTNLNEEELEELPVKDGALQIEARSKEIFTVKIEPDLQASIHERPKGATAFLSSIQLNPKLPAVQFPPVVTLEEVQQEIQRSESVETKLHELRNTAYMMEDEIDRKATQDLVKISELQKVKTEVAALTRQLYESRISTLLNQQLYDQNKIENELKEIGEELCWARTKKRVCEYLSNYYEKQLSANNHR